ncbi:MAG: hypothetical protein V1792_23430 [Pseudomonadota bacterium]
MISRASSGFWRAFERLPSHVQAKAREAHAQWLQNPRHPSLQFKKVHDRYNIFSVRVDLHWRALCTKDADVLIWFWIGTHDDYERILSQI